MAEQSRANRLAASYIEEEEKKKRTPLERLSTLPEDMIKAAVTAADKLEKAIKNPKETGEKVLEAVAGAPETITNEMIETSERVKKLAKRAISEDAFRYKDEANRPLTAQQKFDQYRIENKDTFPQVGLTDLETRFRGKGLSDSMEEFSSVLKSRYPNGELIESNGRLYFTKDATVDKPQFDVVDPSPLENFSIGEIVRDVADLTGIGMEMAGTIAAERMRMGYLKKVSKKLEVAHDVKSQHNIGSVSGRIAADVTGASGGKLVEETGEGVLTEDMQFDAGAVGESAMWTAGGSIAGSAIAPVIKRFWTGSAVNFSNPEAMVAMKFADDNGLDKPMWFQISKSAVLRRSIAQDIEGSSVIPNKIRTSLTQAKASIEDGLNKLLGKGGKVANTAEQALNDYREELFSSLKQMPQKDSYEAGLVLMADVKNYKELSSKYVSGLYKDAITEAGETPVFDMTKAIPVLDELKKVYGAKFTISQDDAIGVFLKENGLEDIPEAKEWLKKLGYKGTDEELEYVIRYNESLDSELLSVVSAIDQTIENNAAPDLEALIKLRSRLFDLKTPANGDIARNKHRQAGQLYSILTDIIENPINDNTKFVSKWQKANNEARIRFNTVEDAYFRYAVNSTERNITTTPESLIRNLSTRDQTSNILFLKELEEQSIKAGNKGMSAYQATQQFFTQDVLSKAMESPADTLKYLDVIGKKQFELLMPDQKARETLVNSLKVFKDFEKTGVIDILEREAADSPVIQKFFFEPTNTKKIPQLIKMADKNPEFKKRMQRGILGEVLGKLQVSDDGLSMNYKVILDDLNTLKSNGAINFLNETQVKNLEDYATYLKVMSSVSQESGSGLQVASVATGIARLEAKALFMMLKYTGASHLFSSKAFNKMLIGDTEKALSKDIINNNLFFKDNFANRFTLITQASREALSELEMMGLFNLDQPTDPNPKNPALKLRGNEPLVNIIDTIDRDK